MKRFYKYFGVQVGMYVWLFVENVFRLSHLWKMSAVLIVQKSLKVPKTGNDKGERDIWEL